jgi:putative ABC transport system permease protein
MFSNYFKTAWRSLLKNKLFSAINIFGLSLGIALCYTILLYVKDEMSYDRFNTKADRIARIIFQANINGGNINESVTMPPVAKTLKTDFPQVEDATRLKDMGTPKIRVQDKVFKEDRFAFADANIFSIFTLPLTEGNPATALTKPNTVVISQRLAQKYFGTAPAMGKTFVVNDNKDLFTITGVMADIPSNSHFHFDLMASMASWPDAQSDSWMGSGYYTYLLLQPGASLRQLEAKFPAMVEKYMGPQIEKNMGLSLAQFRTSGNSLGFSLQPLSAIHLHSATNNELEPGGNATYVYIFSGIAIFMLIVACINFINLSTAGASKRAKEVGVRKVIGSGKAQLIGQFLSESMLLALMAVAVAILMVYLALPAFNAIAGKTFTLEPLSLLGFGTLGIVVGLIAGIYPAFYLSSFQPIAVLKGKLTNPAKRIGMRSALVVTQFVISVGLMIATVVVYQQMKYIRDKNLGYNREQILTIPNSYLLGRNEQSFKNQMLQDSRVVSATTSWYKPVGPSNYNNALAYPEGNDHQLVNGVDFHIDEQYIPTFGMRIVAGRNFSPAYPTDSAGIILNETAAKALGWDNASAIGKTLIRQNSDKGLNYPYHVVGVVQNFNFRSLHENITPLFMTLQPEGGLIFKIKTADVAGLLATMKNQWDQYKTGEAFSYNFLDDLYNKTYAAEQKTGTILNIFAALTILVACLGLFGLATYTAEARTKEIGIRRVLGASVSQVTGMLSTQFIKLVGIASLIAFPLGWLAMNRWLEGFAYRVNIQWWVFAMAGMAAVLVAILTVSVQAIKAAVANPVKSLRSE